MNDNDIVKYRLILEVNNVRWPDRVYCIEYDWIQIRLEWVELNWIKLKCVELYYIVLCCVDWIFTNMSAFLFKWSCDRELTI